MKQKLYPFSFAKNRHSIELVYNTARCALYDMDEGSPEYDYYDQMLGKCLHVLDLDNGSVSYLSGKDIALAKELTLLGELDRSERNKNFTKRS